MLVATRPPTAAAKPSDSSSMVSAADGFGVTRMVGLLSVTPSKASTMPGILAIWLATPSAMPIRVVWSGPVSSIWIGSVAPERSLSWSSSSW